MKIISGSDIQRGDYALHLAFAWTPSPSSKIAKTLLQFCKRFLEVYNKPSNVACAWRAELGRFPLIIGINIKRHFFIT